MEYRDFQMVELHQQELRRQSNMIRLAKTCRKNKPARVSVWSFIRQAVSQVAPQGPASQPAPNGVRITGEMLRVEI